MKCEVYSVDMLSCELIICIETYLAKPLSMKLMPKVFKGDSSRNLNSGYGCDFLYTY